MASNIRVGEVIRVSVRFVNYDAGLNNEDVLIDPTTTTLDIYKLISDAFVLQSSGLTPIQSSTGEYYYDWTPVDNGCYRLLFIGTFDGATPSTVENPRDFFVGTAGPSVTLGTTVEYKFLAELEPMYLDPERILDFFPDADIVDVTEIIYRLSAELEDWFGSNPTITALMEEYIIASVMCELSKVYSLDGGLNGFGSVDNFTLGDLTVNKGLGTSSSFGSLFRGNVNNWCELAALLRNDLLSKGARMKTYVKGSKNENPIPSRRLRRFE